MNSYVLVLLSAVALLIGTASGTCLINLDSTMGSKTPLVLTVDGYVWGPSAKNGDILFKDGEQMQFLCSGRNNYLIDRATIGQQSNATCLNNQFILDANSRNYTFAQLKCHDLPQSEARAVGACIPPIPGSQRIQLGFQVTPSQFIAKIEVCFDANILNTYWSRHILMTSPYSCQVGDTTSWKNDFFGTVKPDDLYKNNLIYEKGHLTPRCDYFTGAEKRMTFYYVNSGPQVGDFNQKNWKDLEGVIRTAANKHSKRFYIYTGTTDIVGSLRGVLPVSQYFWKVVIDSGSGDGVAFVGVNNITQAIANPCPTPTICRRLQWLGQSFLAKVTDMRKGLVFCCPINSLRNIPNIHVPAFSEHTGGVLIRL